MSILLDTHVFLWAAGVNSRLSEGARLLLEDPAETVFFSAVSAWEIALKWSTGRLDLPAAPIDFINNVIAVSGLSQLGITVRDSCGVASLPFHHRDPFDRLLIAQARANGLRILTADSMIEKYDVDVIALWLDEEDE